MIGTYYIWNIPSIITQIIVLIIVIGVFVLIYNFKMKINYIIKKINEIDEKLKNAEK